MSAPLGWLAGVIIDDASLPARSAAARVEREAALADLLQGNRFAPLAGPGGAYHLGLGLHDHRLVWRVSHDDGWSHDYLMAASGMKRVIRDYGIICDSYIEAAHQMTPGQLEAIDMGRRGLHNDAAQHLIERLSGKVEIDFDTARRLFTVLFTLRMR